MTLSLSFHENFRFETAGESFENFSAAAESGASNNGAEIHLCADKLRAPEFENYLPRPRLTDLLDKSLNQIGAALITGRAGTGKTALAAEFAKNSEQISWYSVEASDTDWNLFARYLAACCNDSKISDLDFGTETAPFIENLCSSLTRNKNQNTRLFVLDDIHHVFDAEWFPDFFNTLLYSLSPNLRLIMLSRSNPSVPLWRLRSKRVLSVIDEKLLVFNDEETKELFKKYGSKAKNVAGAQQKSFGRISKLIDLAKENQLH